MYQEPKQPIGYLKMFYPFLDKLARGRILILFMHYYFKVLGILSLIAFLFLCYLIIDQTFASDNVFTGSNLLPVAGVILILFAALLCYGIFQIYFYNADKIRSLGDSEFTVIPIVSISIRLLGEIIAYIALLGGVAGFIISLFISINNIDLLQVFGWFNTAPVWILLTGIFAAIAAIIFFYWFAEAMIVLVDIAKNISLIKDRNIILEPTTQKTSVISTLTCNNCKANVYPEDTFCTNCGNKLH